MDEDELEDRLQHIEEGASLPESRLDHGRRLRKLETDVYFGHGKENPPLTLRVSRVEDSVGEMKTTAKKIQLAAFTALAGALVTFIVDVILNHWK